MAYVIKDRKPTPPWKGILRGSEAPLASPFYALDWTLNVLADLLSRWALPGSS